MTKIIIKNKQEYHLKIDENQESEESENHHAVNKNVIVDELKSKSKSTKSTKSKSLVAKSKSVLKSLPKEISINNYALLLCNDYDYKVIDLKKCAIKSRENMSIKK